MSKNTLKFILGKIGALVLIFIGINLLIAYGNKVLPFGIISDSIALWGVWGYLGLPIALFVTCGGIYAFFYEAIDYWTRHHFD